MTDPRDNYPMTKEEKIKADWETMEKLGAEVYATDLARKEARRVKADKLIEFLRKSENA